MLNFVICTGDPPKARVTIITDQISEGVLSSPKIKVQNGTQKGVEELKTNIEEGNVDIDFKVILISVGDFDVQRSNPNETADIVFDIISMIKKRAADVVIIFAGILTRIHDSADRISKTIQMNNFIREVTYERSNVDFCPCHHKFLSNGRKRPKKELYTWDGRSLSNEGLITLRTEFKKFIDKYINL